MKKLLLLLPFLFLYSECNETVKDKKSESRETELTEQRPSGPLTDTRNLLPDKLVNPKNPESLEKPRSNGSRCSFHKQCKSGICEGRGCGVDEGNCVPADRMCIQTTGIFCNCNSETVTVASAGCPGIRYRHKGACSD